MAKHIDRTSVPPNIAIEIERWPIGKLIPRASNPRTHSREQVAQIAASIREFGWTNPVLVDGDDGILAGHARVLAARKLGMEEIPVIVLRHLSESQRRALVIADTRWRLQVPGGMKKRFASNWPPCTKKATTSICSASRTWNSSDCSKRRMPRRVSSMKTRFPRCSRIRSRGPAICSSSAVIVSSAATAHSRMWLHGCWAMPGRCC